MRFRFGRLRLRAGFRGVAVTSSWPDVEAVGRLDESYPIAEIVQSSVRALPQPIQKFLENRKLHFFVSYDFGSFKGQKPTSFADCDYVMFNMEAMNTYHYYSLEDSALLFVQRHKVTNTDARTDPEKMRRAVRLACAQALNTMLRLSSGTAFSNTPAFVDAYKIEGAGFQRQQPRRNFHDHHHDHDELQSREDVMAQIFAELTGPPGTPAPVSAICPQLRALVEGLIQNPQGASVNPAATPANRSAPAPERQ